jgi:hypothetical protein
MLARLPWWALAAIAVVFIAYSLIAEERRRSMLLAVLDRAPLGTVLSLDDNVVTRQMRVTMGSIQNGVSEQAERGRATDSR